VLLALIEGFLVKKKSVAFWLGMFLCLCLAPTFWEWLYRYTYHDATAWSGAAIYLLLGGAWEHSAPRRATTTFPQQKGRTKTRSRGVLTKREIDYV
jgi:hypothetical protein